MLTGWYRQTQMASADCIRVRWAMAKSALRTCALRLPGDILAHWRGSDRAATQSNYFYRHSIELRTVKNNSRNKSVVGQTYRP